MSLTYLQYLHNGTNTEGIPYYGVSIQGWTTDATLRFYGDGRITTSKGDVAFVKETTQTTTSGKFGDPNSYTIIKTRDPTTPSGWRIKISGQSQTTTAECYVEINYPITLSGIFPGMVSVNIVSTDDTYRATGDQTTLFMGFPTTSGMRIKMNSQANSTNTWPAWIMWSVEGW